MSPSTLLKCIGTATNSMRCMINWNTITTLFLDMDGTLLDLHFDNHFWREHMPMRFAQYNGLELEAAREHLFPRFQSMEGKMEWYCVDYWSQELGMDIAELKREVDHLISIHPHVTDFLSAARDCKKHIALVTNAHSKSLSLKMQRTQLADSFDSIVCAHDIGLPKEEPAFWEKLQLTEPFDKSTTLLVDDSLPVLRSAKQYGIKNLLAVRRPDSKAIEKDVEEFNAINNFSDIMPINHS